MAKQVGITLTGRIIEALPNAMFRVQIDGKHIVLGHLSGKLRTNNITLTLMDSVDVEVSPYDLNRGRITYRHKN